MESCTHYFVIEPANGRSKSKGVCQHCHESRMFDNRSPDIGGNWHDHSGIFPHMQPRIHAPLRGG